MFPDNYFEKKDAIIENKQYQSFLKRYLTDIVKDGKLKGLEIIHTDRTKKRKQQEFICFILRLACINGYIKFLKFIIEKHNFITIDHIKYDDNFLLRFAGLGGHTDIIEYLVNRYKLTENDIKTNNNEILRYSLLLNLDKQLEYLYNNFDFSEFEKQKAYESIKRYQIIEEEEDNNN